MDKWRANKQARKNIATRHLMVELWYEYQLRLKRGENPVNYAHRVWLGDKEFVPENETVSYQKEIVEFIKDFKEGEEYQALLNGTAPDELIEGILDDYIMAREEWK